MDGVSLDAQRADEAGERSRESGDNARDRFRQGFEELMAGGESAGGLTRMRGLEELTRQLRADLDSSTLTYVSDMIGSLDERGIIDSKDASSSGAASS